MKKLIYILFISITILFLSACTKNEETAFKITCTGETPKENGMKQTGNSIYEFDKNQYITKYEVTTITIFDDAEVYKTYKASSEDTIKNNTSSQIVYDVKGDDKTNTLTFNYKVILNSEDLLSADDKDFYKAVNVLKRAESNSKCTIEGIDRSDIK